VGAELSDAGRETDGRNTYKMINLILPFPSYFTSAPKE
jgi:hypothetical protein